MAHLDYRTNEEVDPQTLDSMESFLERLSPLHRYALLLMTADAIASEDYDEATETDTEDGATALNCPHCGEMLTEITEVTFGMGANPADFSGASASNLIVQRVARRAPRLAWQCPECLRFVSLPPEIDVS